MNLSPAHSPQIIPEEEIEAREEIERPYRVLVHNDEVTPYDFVIVILVRIFDISPIDAEMITWMAHTDGCPGSRFAIRRGKFEGWTGALCGYPRGLSSELQYRTYLKIAE